MRVKATIILLLILALAAAPVAAQEETFFDKFLDFFRSITGAVTTDQFCEDNDGDGFSVTTDIVQPAIDIESSGNIIAPAGNLNLDVMAAQITYGKDGPEIDVMVKLLQNEEATSLFNGNDVDGGESYSVSLSEETNIAIEGRAKYQRKFDRTYRSNAGSKQVKVLQNGDRLPNVPIYGGQQALSEIIAPFVDENNRIDIDINQVLLLFEFGSLNSASADFQDLVVLITFAPHDWDVECGAFDCDDTNNEINPDAREICDGIDNNCDFVVDEDCLHCQPSEEICDGEDNDCDGIIDNIQRSCGETDEGTCSFGTQTCVEGNWGICEGEIIPDIEVCNGLDDDCDGAIDEALTQVCGSDEGSCTTGTQACVDGEWAACSGTYTAPTDEVCDGVDNNCDGQIDNGASCECVPGDTRACGSDEGACSAGTQQCVSGHWSRCSDAVEPTEELCDGVDNDCDGFIDEDVTRTCGESDMGACAFGTQTCTAGEWGVCEGEITAQTEICNNLDDDCDGATDESVTQQCGSTDIGVCAYGLKTCTAGIWGSCQDSIDPIDEVCNDLDDDCDGIIDNGDVCAPVCYPEAEICDGIDNNCDGVIDENCPPPCDPSGEICDGIDNDCDGEIDEELTQVCGSDIGACAYGVSTCSDGDWGECLGEIKPTDEVCNNIDDNCDGTIDEAVTQVCGSDIGVCSAGMQTCTAGEWSLCGGESYLTGSNEVCNNLDDDCDGIVDNGIDCACTDGSTRSCGSDIGACTVGTQVCANGLWGECDSIAPIPETCNGIDDDCDGTIDEEITRSCGETDIGACSYGTQTCTAGNWSACINATVPVEETCNGLDDNCDGFVDEALFQQCGTTDVGVCQFGIQTCTNGDWDVCVDAIEPDDEVCGNNLDDDCDGQVNEDCTVRRSSGGGGGGGRSRRKAPPLPLPKETVTAPDIQPVGEDKGHTFPVPKIELHIIKAPEVVDATDQKFIIEAIARNTGAIPFTDVVVTAKEHGHWSIEPVMVGALGALEEKTVILTAQSTLCTQETPEGDQIITQEQFDIIAEVEAKDFTTYKVSDQALKGIPLVYDPFALMIAPQDYEANNIMKTCFVINNKANPERTKTEIEFELADRQNDLIIDFISPVNIPADSNFLKVKDYTVREVPRQKEYQARSALYENGTLFTDGYLAGDAQAPVELKHGTKKKVTFKEYISNLLNIFRGEQ